MRDMPVMTWVLWNLMLATIPVVLGYSMLGIDSLRKLGRARYLVILPLLLVWFVFLPNSCYLLTEWRHFMESVDAYNMYVRTEIDSSHYAPLFAMSLFYFGYSAFGMMAFAFAIRPVERMLAQRKIPIWHWGLPFFVLVSLGVYLGLILRFNSWDFATRPGIIWSAILDVSSRPRLSAFIVLFGVFLWIAYEVLDIWIDGAVAKLRRFKEV